MRNSKANSPKEIKGSPKRVQKQNSPKTSPQPYKVAKPTKECGTIEKKEENYLARCTNFRLTTGYELSICNCKHVRRMTLGERHSIVNPQRWLCNVCFTTESVWACLSCPNVACGRYIQEHALTHFLESDHPLAIDVNELYVFCYKCDDYVLNDNNSSDIKVLRETLQAIRYQNFTGTTRSGHTLRSAMISEQEDLEMRRQMQQEQLDRDDRLFTAIWHSRFVRQRKAFRRWLRYIRWKRVHAVFPPGSSDEEEEDMRPDIEVVSDEEEASAMVTSSELPQVEPKVEAKTTDEELGAVEASATTIGAEISPTNEKSPDTCSESVSPLIETVLSIPSAVEEKAVQVTSIPCPVVQLQDLKDSSKDTCSGVSFLMPPIPSATPTPATAPAKSDIEPLGDTLQQPGTPPVKKDAAFLRPAPPVAATVFIPPASLISFPSPKKEVKLVTVTLPSSTVLKHTLAYEKKTDLRECEKEVPAKPTESEQPMPPEDSKEVKPAVLNILSRPKRSTAARRYKEIFWRLIDDREIPAKRVKRAEKVEVLAPKKVGKFQKPKKLGVRSSNRLKKMNEEKDKGRVLRKRERKPSKEDKKRKQDSLKTLKARAALRKKRELQKSSKVAAARKRKTIKEKAQRSRRLIVSRTLQDKKRPPYRSPSLYDYVPNRAVTSLIPGVTGLRNLGNTCYLNSIIQVLGHLQKFRRCLLALRELEFMEVLSGYPNDALYTSRTVDGFIPQSKAAHIITRRSTVELYEEQTRPQPLPSRKSDRLRSGLNGGQSMNDAADFDAIPPLSPSNTVSDRSQNSAAGPNHWSPSLSLCNELDHLYRVMWSGKWKLVSPYHFLHSVWSLIPSFRGYTQQDAQEFLCELLDKIVSELERCHTLSSTENKLALRILKVVQKVFEGRLMSSVRCLQCGHVSATVEPFWDLSLEFPERYHRVTSMKRRYSTGGKSSCSASQEPCTLHEMLRNFTAPETLEGGKVYGCAKCNFFQQSRSSAGSSQKKRNSCRKNSQLLTEAEKQLKVLELPQVIRFHLKRFRWIGRNHREKITVHVDFPPELDMRDYCWSSDRDCSKNMQYMYDLSAVVIHHGRGFGSGHYTANCWNDIGEFWVHCNDSHLELRSIEDVMTSQAYILFYTQRGLDPHPHILSPPPTPKTSPSPMGSVPTPFDPPCSHSLPIVSESDTSKNEDSSHMNTVEKDDVIT